MATTTVTPIAIFQVPTELWDDVQKHLPSIRDRINAILAFRDVDNQSRSQIASWKIQCRKMTEEADIKANILDNDRLANTFARHLHIETDAWHPKNLKQSPSSPILQHHPTLSQFTYTRLRRNQQVFGIRRDILDVSQYRDQDLARRAILFPPGQASPAASAFPRERGCATFLFDIVRNYNYLSETCQARLCHVQQGRGDADHKIKLCRTHTRENIRSLQYSSQRLSSFGICITSNDTQPGAILSWAHPYSMDNVIKALPQTEIDVIVRGIYGKPWIELQQSRNAIRFNSRQREFKGRQYSACIKAVRLIRNWFTGYMHHGQASKDTELLGSVISRELAPAFRTATGYDLNTHTAIVGLLQYAGNQYMATPPSSERYHQGTSPHMLGLMEDMWADFVAAEWIKEGLRALGWYTKPEMLRLGIVAEKLYEPLIISRSFDTSSEKSYSTALEVKQLCLAIHNCSLDHLQQSVDSITQRRNLSVYLHVQAAIDELERQVGPGMAEALYDICIVVTASNTRTDISAFEELPPFRDPINARFWLQGSAGVWVEHYEALLSEYYMKHAQDVHLAQCPAEVNKQHVQVMVRDFWKHSKLPCPMTGTKEWCSAEYAIIILDEPEESDLWKFKNIDPALSGPWREVLNCFENRIFGVAKGCVDQFVEEISKDLFGEEVEPFCCGRVLWFDDSQTPKDLHPQQKTEVQYARMHYGFPTPHQLEAWEDENGEEDVDMTDA